MQTLKQIAIIEDDADIRQLLELSLSTLGGYTVLTYPLASIAIKQLPSNTLPQMIILDVMMPELSGPEFIPLLRALPKGNSVCIVMLTAKAATEELAPLLTAGANFVACKPFDPMLLPELLQHFWSEFHA
ncbi:response regulator [uncultured Deefgea sp.]|uniref:response regulator n=1 Tax=uncultured Deefgea sp. TaxID=1304914 RepID=UPI002637E9C3|nr:response regulator [uncultured Deefgea sp.]